MIIKSKILSIKFNSTIISDYKPKKWKIFKSLPQIIVYAMFLRERIKDYGNYSNLEVKCTGFTKDHAIEWNPDIVFPKIIEFVEKENKNRKNKLLTTNKKNKKDLLTELRKLLN